MEYNITIANATALNIEATVVSGDEKKRYGIPRGGQVVHPFTANENEPYPFRIQAQQVGGPLSSDQEEGMATGPTTIQVFIDNTGERLSIRMGKQEEMSL